MKNTNDNWLNDLRRERLQSTSRNPGAAALMSFFVMGMGQIYAGHIDRGIMLMGFHFSGIFAAYSLYSNGILYEALFPYLGAHLIVMCSYVVSVFFILLWIYNIKDAYYLSLFASFRDWFEVERVLLPLLKEQPGSLLTGPSAAMLADSSEDYDEEPVAASQPAFAGVVDKVVDSEPPTPSSAPAAEVSAAVEDAEEADVLEFRVDRKTQPKKLDKRRQEEKSETAHVVSGRDFEAISAYGSSWRLYAGLVVIFVLVGVWFNNRQAQNVTRSGNDSTLFAVSAEMGKNAGPAVESVAPSSTPVDITASTAISLLPVATPAGSEPPVTVTQPAVESVQVSTAIPDETPAAAEAAVLPAKASEPPLLKGLELVRNGSLNEAAAMFEEDLRSAEPSEDSWKVVLNTFYRTDNKVAYELNLRRYLKKYGNDSAAWFNLGKLLYDRNELVQASQAIASGLKADPDNVRGNFLLGSIYSDLKLHEDSAIYLSRAVNIEPLNIEFNRMLARSLAAAGKTQDAVKYYQRVSSLAPDDKEARQAIATSRPEMAMAFSADDTDDNQVLVVMGKAESRLIEKNREELPVQQMGKVLYESSEVDAGQDLVEVKPVEQPSPLPVEKTPTDPINMIAPAVAPPVTVVEKADEKPVVETAPEKVATVAAVEASAVSEPEPEVKSVTKGSGISDLEVAKAEPEADALRDTEAVSAPVRANSKKPSRIEEYRQRGSYEFSRGNWEAALPHYLNILKEKKDAQTYDIVGLIFEKLSMNQDAFDAVEHAYKMGMRDSATLAKLGRLAEINGDFKKGEYYLFHALQKIPHRVDLRIRYARCLEANGREEIALKELDKIVRASTDSYAVRRRAELEIQKIRNRRQ